MRVLFTTWAWQPHLYPMVPLGWAFAAAGHEVRVATQPALVEAVTRSGLPAMSVGRDFQFQESGPRSPDASIGGQDRARVQAAVAELTTELVDAMADGLIEAAELWRPDLVVWDPLTLAGPIAARQLKVPDVELLWGPDFVASVRQETTRDGSGKTRSYLEARAI